MSYIGRNKWQNEKLETHKQWSLTHFTEK